ncbi:hypothetical protein EV182_008128, partial [Spiromyces aspiralis]
SKITGFAYLPTNEASGRGGEESPNIASASPTPVSHSPKSGSPSEASYPRPTANPFGYGISKEPRLLVSSNDSRLRMYSLREQALLRKYKGHVNASSQANATFSSNGQYMISGSEDHNIYVWSVAQDNAATVATHPSCDHIRAKSSRKSNHGISSLTQPLAKLFNHASRGSGGSDSKIITAKDLEDEKCQQQQPEEGVHGGQVAEGQDSDSVQGEKYESLEGKVVEKSIYEYFPAHDAT